MRMRVKKTVITVDYISQVVDIGELAKLGAQLGYSVVIEPGDDYEGEESGRNVVRLIRDRHVQGLDDLAHLAVVYAVTAGESGEQVLERIKKRMKIMDFPMDKPIADVMGIGEGPGHEGHTD